MEEEDWTKKESHLIYNQILTYKAILIHQRKKLNHLRNRWRQEKKSKLLPDIDTYFETIINYINTRESDINEYIQKYFINFFEMIKLGNIINNEYEYVSGWMALGDEYGRKYNKKIKKILDENCLIYDFNPFFIDENKENFEFNSINEITSLKKFVENQYEIISLIEHCFNQRVQGSQIPVFETRVTDVEKIGGTQIMYYAADSLVLDYLNYQGLDFKNKSHINKVWNGLTNFGYDTDFKTQAEIIIAPGWSKYIHPESWILFSHECGHLNFSKKTLDEALLSPKSIPFTEIINKISEAISPLYNVQQNSQIAEDIFSDMYATFMSGIDYLPPLTNLHFSPSVGFNEVPLRIEICIDMLKCLELDTDFIKERIQSLNLDIARKMAYFELIKKYRENMFYLHKYLELLEKKNISWKLSEQIINKLLKDSKNKFIDEISDKIIGLDSYSHFSNEFCRRGIIDDIKKLISNDFYSSLTLIDTTNSCEINANNNIKEIILALISSDLEKRISYQQATNLCDEIYMLSQDSVCRFYEDTKNFERFHYLIPLLKKYENELLSLFNYDIVVGIKPRHLISMMTKNKNINMNIILFALSHNNKMRLRYQ